MLLKAIGYIFSFFMMFRLNPTILITSIFLAIWIFRGFSAFVHILSATLSDFMSQNEYYQLDVHYHTKVCVLNVGIQLIGIPIGEVVHNFQCLSWLIIIAQDNLIASSADQVLSEGREVLVDSIKFGFNKSSIDLKL